MTQTETSLRECVIAVQGELATMGTRVGTDWEDGMFLLKMLLDAVAMRNAHLPVTMTMDAATRRNAYDFARWFRKQETDHQLEAVTKTKRDIIDSWKKICEVEKWRLDGLTEDGKRVELQKARDALNRELREFDLNRAERRDGASPASGRNSQRTRVSQGAGEADSSR